MPIRVKRICDVPHGDDGLRILVDRLWPRGVKKEDAAIDQWLRECAPSGELRKWFGHDRTKWNEFRKRYFAELKGKDELLAPIRAASSKKRVTLLFGASDTEFNNAVALMEYLGTNARRKKRTGKQASKTISHRTRQ
ncbi:MAG: DUF488 domain-containing protein [Gammaproteobacteria bacterium]|nr:DUF488 domain-containing protein [Gammaproteobacteria bacterium]